MTDGADAPSSSPLDAVAAAVNKLYDTRNKFFNTHAVDKAGEKSAAVAKAKAEAMSLVLKLAANPDVAGNAEYSFLAGKALNITEEFDQAAETALSKAVKLDPKHVEGWNNLGECFWKKNDMDQAKSCFESALEIKENKESLRSLSMLLRRIGAASELERKANIVESLDLAKKAIKLDLTDGHSWFVLGNAYLALFFASMDTVEHIRQALKAYKRAESDKVEGTNNPDLHQNRATIHKYQEDYGMAIEGFQLASWLDPDWLEPKNSLTALQEQLERISSLIEKEGGFKQKRISGVRAVLELDGASRFSPISELVEGVNDLKTVRVAVMTVFTEETLPQTFLAIDAAGTWVCVTIYNMDQGAIVADDTIEIQEPYLRKVQVTTVPVSGTAIQSKKIEYLSIRVDNPVTLKKGGVPLGESKLVKAQVKISSSGD